MVIFIWLVNAYCCSLNTILTCSLSPLCTHGQTPLGAGQRWPGPAWSSAGVSWPPGPSDPDSRSALLPWEQESIGISHFLLCPWAKVSNLTRLQHTESCTRSSRCYHVELHEYTPGWCWKQKHHIHQTSVWIKEFGKDNHKSEGPII